MFDAGYSTDADAGLVGLVGARWLVAVLVFAGTFGLVVGVMWAARRGHWSVTAEYLVVVGAILLGAAAGWLAVRGA